MRTLLFALSLCLAAPAFAQGRIVFEATRHDFGAIEEGVQAEHVFTFRNEGDAPLHLTDVRPSCGCTAPSWTKEPVIPGETGAIRVVYDSKGRPGPFKKSIRVTLDAEPEVVLLYIEGDVAATDLTGPAQGHLVFDRERADLGTVHRGAGVAHTFRLQNKGVRPIRIVEVDRDAPLRVRYAETPLFQGDLAELQVIVVTEDLAAGMSFDYALVLHTDDTEQPLKSLRLTGRVADDPR